MIVVSGAADATATQQSRRAPQVIWMDADVLVVTDPGWAFESEPYLAAGGVFWRDLSADPHWLTAAFLRGYGVAMVAGERELEAGLFALHKARSWVLLQVQERGRGGAQSRRGA